LLLGFYFVLRQRWAIVAGGATTIGVAALLSLLLFGIDGNVAWYQDWVVPYLNGYIPAYNVQSVDGFLVRLSQGEEFLIHWDPPFVPTAFHRIARFLMFAALYGGSLVLIWRAHRRAPVVMAEGGPSPRDLLELSLMINLALLTSPISWTHYYLWLLLPWALYLGGDLPLGNDATTRFLMRASIILVSLPVIIWSPMEPSWYAAILSRTLVSVWLIGGCLSFVALARGLWQVEAAAASDNVSALRAAP
jgi:Glycosyltransferase family 87